MTTAISDATLRTCETFRKAVAGGEDPSDVVGILANEYGVRRPAIYRRLRSGGVLPGYHRRENMGPRAAGVHKHHGERRIVPPPPIANRDPCPRCGVRRDIGCGHSPVRLGMVL